MQSAAGVRQLEMERPQTVMLVHNETASGDERLKHSHFKTTYKSRNTALPDLHLRRASLPLLVVYHDLCFTFTRPVCGTSPIESGRQYSSKSSSCTRTYTLTPTPSS